MSSEPLRRADVGRAFPSLRGAVAQAGRASRHFQPVLLLLVVLVIIFAVTQERFLDTANVKTLLTGVSLLWVVSMGMTFVLISAGVDLSVPATIGLAGVVLAKLTSAGLPGGVAIALTICFGVGVGALANGFFIGRLGLSFFVTTLASLTALTGLLNVWTNAQTFFVTAPLVGDIGTGELLGVPDPIWIMVVTFLLGLYVQQRTFIGRDIYALGGNPTAARLSGINVPRTIVIVYAISGGCAALAAVIGVGRIGAATPQIEGSIGLQAAAAALLGGTSLFGGMGGVGGTALGVLVIGVLQNGLSLSGIDGSWQDVVTGVILLAAVLGDRVNREGAARGVFRRLRMRAASAAHHDDTSPTTNDRTTQ